MKKIIYTFLITFAIVGIAEAVNPFDIQYPVLELGDCGSQQECKAYCDEPTNVDACISFAKNQGMIGEDEADRMREKTEEFRGNLEEFENSPGSCVTPQECDAYCHVEEHLNECLDYGVKYGHTTAEEAQKIREQVERGGPGGCKSNEECRSYCDNPDNADKCFAFVIEEGKITAEEAEFMQERMKAHRGDRGPRGPEEDMEDIDKEKVEGLLQEMGGPGGCKTMEECGQYCSDFSHGEECIEFAVKHQIAPPEALEKMKRMSAIKSGPGGCVGPEECDAFCSEPENRQECFEFTKNNQVVSPEEIMMMEREMRIADKLDSGMAGPGGCMGPKECDNFCRNSENIEECINFSSEHGLLSGDRVKEMMGKSRGAMQKMRDIEGQKQFFLGPPPEGEEFGMPFFGGPPRGDDFEGQMPPEGFDPPMSPEEFEKMKEEGMLPPDAMIPSFGGDPRHDNGFNMPEECEKVGALSPEACERHMRDIQNFESGCDDCSAQCPTEVSTNCVNDRCVCGEVDSSGFREHPESDSDIPPFHDNRFIPPTKEDIMNFKDDFTPPFGDDFRPPQGDDFRQPQEPEGFRDNFKPSFGDGSRPPEGFDPTQMQGNFSPPMDDDFIPPMQNDDFIQPVSEEPIGYLSPFQFLGSMINALMIK